jgi:hypothetical protein
MLRLAPRVFEFDVLTSSGIKRINVDKVTALITRMDYRSLAICHCYISREGILAKPGADLLILLGDTLLTCNLPHGID